MKDPQFLISMVLYAVLAFAAWRTLEAELLWATWILVAVFAIKTVLVVLRRRWD